MAKCTEVIYEGWLTKSPPTKRIWRARWRRRWFLLTHSGDIPGQYILTYYTNRNRTKLKGVIDLDHCEQVDLGLKLEERNLKFDHIFGIKTPNRTYYLAADTEAEMKSWVTCICRVCGLKSTNEEEDLGIPMNTPSDIEITEESSSSLHHNNISGESPPISPISPVSTSPYIAISECITGKSPIFDPKDFKRLFEYNQNQKKYLSSHCMNETYNEYHANNYVNLNTADPERNYVNDTINDPRFYDCPRKLSPQKNKEINTSLPPPLQSPSDSDSVFNEDESQIVQSHKADLVDISKRPRPSDSSIENEPSSIIGKSLELCPVPPPRPPKSSHINAVSAGCLNLPLPAVVDTNKKEFIEEKSKISTIGKVTISDDMYDFPRSHIYLDQDKNTLQRRHCYNNAAPTKHADGIIFQYEISPKPSTSSATSVFRYDLEATQDLEPCSSPAISQTSSTPAYSNLPSPALLTVENSVFPPPTINRDLKPKRKLSDTLSTCSTTEPPSPRNAAPSVDRKLKPLTPLQDASMRRSFLLNEEDVVNKRRAAPSPTPPTLLESTYQNQNDENYQHITTKMQYIDLDLEGPSSSVSSSSMNTLKKSMAKPNDSDTVYKKVDFMKTEAFKLTRNILEKERQEPVTTFVKK